MITVTKFVRHEERESKQSIESLSQVMARFRALGYREFKRDSHGRVILTYDRDAYERGHYIAVEI